MPEQETDRRILDAKYKAEVKSSLEIIDKRISTLEGHFSNNGILSQINKTLNNIDERLFSADKGTPIVIEVRDLKKTVETHLKEHLEKSINKTKILLIILGVILTNTIGIYVGNLTYRVIYSNNQHQEQVQK